jgi:RNA polymerase sigma-B factor
MSPSTELAMERFAEYQASGDRAVRDELVVEHLGLARALARRYSGRGEAVEDLQQVAMVGLVKAVERFDPGRGLSFTTFAVPTITGEIKRHFRDRTWATRVPRALQELALRLTDTVRELSQELGHSPSIAEIAERLGIDEERVLEAMEVSRSYTASSLDAPADEESGGSRYERVLGGDDAGYEGVEQRMTVDFLLSTLSERDRTIVTLRFFDNLTQSEIAERVGISQMHVSRLLARALESLHGVIAEA